MFKYFLIGSSPNCDKNRLAYKQTSYPDLKNIKKALYISTCFGTAHAVWMVLEESLVVDQGILMRITYRKIRKAELLRSKNLAFSKIRKSDVS